MLDITNIDEVNSGKRKEHCRCVQELQ